MKIAKNLLVTAGFLAVSLVAAPAALAADGTGDAGTGSHYLPGNMGVGHGGDNPYVGGHEGVGHGGDNPYAATVKVRKATGEVTRAVHRFDSEGRTVKTRLLIENVRATKITVTTVSCQGEVLKKASRDANPAAAGHWTYEYKVRTPKGAAMSIVKFSQDNKRSTKQAIYATCP